MDGGWFRGGRTGCGESKQRVRDKDKEIRGPTYLASHGERKSGRIEEIEELEDAGEQQGVTPAGDGIGTAEEVPLFGRKKRLKGPQKMRWCSRSRRLGFCRAVGALTPSSRGLTANQGATTKR